MILLSDFGEVDDDFRYNKPLWREKLEVQASPADCECYILLSKTKQMLLNCGHLDKNADVLSP